jgi:hypothetical protein
MPVYHISNFDVSAVQIDLSSNIFIADSSANSADYWVEQGVNFNVGGAIQEDISLNNIFKNVLSTTDISGSPVYRNSLGTRSATFSTHTQLTDVQFKDLGVLNKNGHTLFNSAIYSNITNLRAYTLDSTSFTGKVHNVLSNKTSITGLRERMIASINAATGSDLGTNQPVPINSQFGFLVVRNLNFPGTNQDQTIHIGVVLKQNS